MVLDAGIVNVTVQALLGVVPLPPPEADARTKTIPATTITQAAMTMALRFILNRHRSPFVLYNLSCAVPLRNGVQRSQAGDYSKLKHDGSPPICRSLRISLLQLPNKCLDNFLVCIPEPNVQVERFCASRRERNV